MTDISDCGICGGAESDGAATCVGEDGIAVGVTEGADTEAVEDATALVSGAVEPGCRAE